MALTLSAMRTLLGEMLSSDLDNYKGESPTPAQLTAQINYGIRTVSRFILQFDPSVTLTLTAGTMKYDLRSTSIVSRKIIDARAVYINGNILYASSNTRPGLYTLAELELEYPTWRSAGSGTPTRAMQFDQYLYLIDKPDSTIAAATNYIAGTVMARDMVDSTDDSNYPEFPEELHETAVQVAAVFASDPMVTEAEAIARINRFDARALELMNEIRSRNARIASSFGSTSGRYQTDYTLV